MNLYFRLATALAACLIVLAACKPASDKPASSAAPAAPAVPASQPAAMQAIPANAPQPSASGQYLVLSTPLDTPQGNKIEVLEFFAYFCSHCKSFDPLLTEWARKNAGKVIFKRVPVAFRDNMESQQRMYYALEAMGKLEGLHEKIFHAVQDERRALTSEAEIIAFVAQNGVDQVKFKELFGSFSIQSQARNASQLQAAYRIESVPNIALDGRYITSASHTLKRPGVEQTESGLQTATLQIMDELVAKALKDRQGAKK
jgi:thiol:disulfide interchange protein DsbA